MIHPKNEAAVMDSWRRCTQAGLPPDPTSLYPLASHTLEGLREKYQRIISVFEHAASSTAASLPRSSSFLLLDGQGTLLKKNT